MALKKVDMEFQIEFEDLKQAKIVMKALEPEINSSPSERSTVKLNLTGTILDVNIKASDVTSLRASVNSYLRWIMLSVDVMNVNSF
ncbi:MAG TPA: KEOPS complex subunit Pcc1 [Methanobacterium sp.]